MKRNKYSKEFEEFIKDNVSKYTKEQLLHLINSKFNIDMSKDSLRRYLNRHNIKDKYIDYKQYNVRNVYKCSIGTERATNEGTFVKVESNVWRRKTRVIYEKYHNYKLNDDDYIVFLNQNNNDFSKDNLIKSSRREIAYLHNCKTFSNNAELTKLGILSARLMIKAKEKQTNISNI